MNQNLDVLIVGGGPAGLTAALTLARGGRIVMVCDDGHPRNARASHMQNFPSRDGTPPAEFRDQIKKDLAKYEHVSFNNKGVQSITKNNLQFEVVLNDQTKLSSKKIILAHGVRDILPDLPGVNEIFGKSLFFCPYCHGYEHKNQPLALLGNGDFIIHMSAIVSGLTNDLKIFTNGPATIPKEQLQHLEKKNIEVIEDEIESFIHEGDNLQAIRLKNNKIIPRLFAFTHANFKLRSDLGILLGCELTEMGLYKIDEMGKTSVHGVYAAGDIVGMRHSVLMACNSGQLAAASTNYEILSERFV